MAELIADERASKLVFLGSALAVEVDPAVVDKPEVDAEPKMARSKP